MLPTRRTLLAASALAAVPGALRAQQDRPTRPITLIVRFPAGDGPDLMGRAIAEYLAPPEEWLAAGGW